MKFKGKEPKSSKGTYLGLVDSINEANYNQKSKEQITDYLKELTAEGKAERTKYLYGLSLHYLAQQFPKKDLLKLELKKDLIEFSEWMEKAKDENGKKRFGIYACTYYLSYIKSFFLRYLEEGLVKKELKFIKKGQMPRKLQHDEYLTHEDILCLVEAAGSKRNQAMIYVGWESGLRASTFIKVRIKDLKQINFEEKQAFQLIIPKEHLKVKKDSTTPVPFLLNSVPHLLKYLEVHEYRNDPNAPLFYSQRSEGKAEPLRSKYLNLMLQRVGKRTSIKKPLFWHGLRHSHTKFLRTEGYNDAIIKRWHGLSPKSNMLETYSDFGASDVLDALAKKEGLIKDAPKKKIEPKVCPRCKHNNTPDAKYCSKCWLVLDPEEAKNLNLKTMLDDEKLEMMTEAIFQKLQEKMKKGKN